MRCLYFFIFFIFQNAAIFFFLISYNGKEFMERKDKMSILDKKEFYKMILKDRLPVAQISFSGEQTDKEVEFYRTPLGTVLRIKLNGEERPREIKMYDKKRGRFSMQNVFCGDNLIEISKGTFVGVSSKLQIEDLIGREFLIKLDDVSIIARAQMLPKRELNVDKFSHLVYN